MKQPNVNEVWVMKNKHLALIVSSPSGLKVLYRDRVDNMLFVTSDMDCLDHKTETDIHDFLTSVSDNLLLSKLLK